MNIINDNIKFPQIRLIDEDGTSLGVVKINQARQIQKEKKLDLVCMNEESKPPVCKIMDYKKHVYDTKRAKKENQKKNRRNQIITKEIRFSGFIAEHDLGIKANQARKFLEKGNKVLVTLRIKGRMVKTVEEYNRLLNQFHILCGGDNIKIESRTGLNNKQMTMVLSKN